MSGLLLEGLQLKLFSNDTAVRATVRLQGDHVTFPQERKCEKCDKFHVSSTIFGDHVISRIMEM